MYSFQGAVLKCAALLLVLSWASALDITGSAQIDSSDNLKVVGGDHITASTNADNIDLIGGNDLYVYALDGNDVLEGGEGNDTTLNGGGGDDVVSGGPGFDGVLIGGTGDDTVDGGDGDDGYLYGGADNDVVNGGAGDDYKLNGEMGNDVINGGEGDDKTLNGGLNDDIISGGPGDDTNVYGGDGNDDISGDAGNDQLIGGSGNDNITGGAGNDTVQGDVGTDTFVVGSNDGFDVAPVGGFIAAEDILSIPVTADLTVVEAGPDTILRVDNSEFKLTGVIDIVEDDLTVQRTPVMSPTTAPTPKAEDPPFDPTITIIGASVAAVGVLTAAAVVLYRRRLIAEDIAAEAAEAAGP